MGYRNAIGPQGKGFPFNELIVRLLTYGIPSIPGQRWTSLSQRFYGTCGALYHSGRDYHHFTVISYVGECEEAQSVREGQFAYTIYSGAHTTVCFSFLIP